jgi:hypothetical protein
MNDPKPTPLLQPLARQRAELIMQVRSGSLTAKEAARQLRISRKTYYKWERRALAAMAEALVNRRHGRPPLRVDPAEDPLHALWVENTGLRIRELQHIVFMLRLVIGYVTPELVNQHLRNKLSPKDLITLYSYLTGHSRCNRIRALIVIFDLCGLPRDSIARGLGTLPRTVTKYVRIFRRCGVDALFPPRKGVAKWEDPKYKDTLFGILHSPPRDHGFNRTTWRGKDLECAMARIGMPIGKDLIGVIIRNAGYRFMKAREVLTSNDPKYREKVNHIHLILSTLKQSERFFSIDEFGPFAVKQQGGRRLVGPGEYPIVPQFQKSKGCLIVTAALELSTNQVTHFYSSGKNTVEMIKLLELLLCQYRDCTRLYLSWDAASWHASKSFEKKVNEINSPTYRQTHGTPIVEMAPLPARAQFLNVIESVFSGLAGSVIHSSDYASVDEAKAAIDRYFAERNLHFQQNPKRAGNKIWGNERAASTFQEGQNCKNPRFR